MTEERCPNCNGQYKINNDLALPDICGQCNLYKFRECYVRYFGKDITIRWENKGICYILLENKKINIPSVPYNISAEKLYKLLLLV